MSERTSACLRACQRDEPIDGCSSDSFTDTTSGKKRKRVPEEGGWRGGGGVGGGRRDECDTDVERV